MSGKGTGTGTEPLAGLYVHVPFCTSVCPYCDFAVLIAGPERRQEYVDALIREIDMCRDSGFSFDTVYLGGGTPSSLQPVQLGRILGAVRERLSCVEPWLYLEANPEDVTPENVAAWRSLGIRTVSLGVQSLDDRALRLLGRWHSAEQARRAVRRLQDAGFRSLSLDLVYGYPGHEPAAWRRQLDEVTALRPDHLSCYQLTIHEGTVLGRRLARGEVGEPVVTVQAELFETTHRLLADAGFEGYEVSSFCAGREHRSRHNIKYWSHAPYLGVGPSAHSFARGRRWWNTRKLRDWGRAVDSGRRPVAGEEELSREEMALEAIMLGLRTADGVDLQRVRDRFGVDVEAANAHLISTLIDQGLLVCEGDRLQPTLAGFAVADGLARSFEVR